MGVALSRASHPAASIALGIARSYHSLAVAGIISAFALAPHLMDAGHLPGKQPHPGRLLDQGSEGLLQPSQRAILGFGIRI